MSLLYLCTLCNRKYKTKEKLAGHYLSAHERIAATEDISEPVEITNENKARVDKQRVQALKQQQHLNKIREIEEKQRLQQLAKQEAADRYKEEHVERYRQLELETLKQKEAQLRIEQQKHTLVAKWVALLEQIQKNCLENPDDCCICFERPVDTAPIPCGHLNFCYVCIDGYRHQFRGKGCPICKQRIQDVNKIYTT